MDVAEAFDLIARARGAHGASGAYLVVGDLRGGARELVDRLLARLFPDAAAQLAAHTHPDVAWLEPEGRSRTIKTETLRARVLAPMESTAFSGGWKVGVVVGADRLQPNAANAFLKSLEEPTPRTLYLLLTDRPDALLPTIVSRCQRIDLPPAPDLLTGEAAAAVERVLGRRGLKGVFEKAEAARALAALLGALKDEAEDADVPLVRKAFYRTVMAHVRRWMVEGAVPRPLAFRNVEAVEEAYQRSERFIPDEPVLAFMMDKLVLPQ